MCSLLPNSLCWLQFGPLDVSGGGPAATAVGSDGGGGSTTVDGSDSVDGGVTGTCILALDVVVPLLSHNSAAFYVGLSLSLSPLFLSRQLAA
jgi:hypothetical protein